MSADTCKHSAQPLRRTKAEFYNAPLMGRTIRRKGEMAKKIKKAKKVPRKAASKRGAAKRSMPKIKGAKGGERRAAKLKKALGRTKRVKEPAPFRTRFQERRLQRKAAVKQTKGKGGKQKSARKSKVTAQSDLDAVTLALHRAGIPLVNAGGKACATVADRVQVALDRLADVASVGRMNENAPPATGAASSAS